MGRARGVRGYHDGRGFPVALRHQVKVHLANDVAHRDLDDDILGAGPTDVPDGDLEGSAAAGLPPLAGSPASRRSLAGLPARRVP